MSALDGVFVSASGVGLVFAISGDLAALDDKAEGLVLTAADILHSISIKLPPFWPVNIETWLIQSESQFRLKGVTVSQTKFDHVVQSMSQQDAVKVLDLIRAPPRDDPYSHFKSRLLLMYGLTDYVRFEAISSLPFSKTCCLQLSCPRCYLFYQLVTSLVSFSVGLSSNASPQMSGLTFSMTTPRTPSPWLSVLTRSTRVKSPPPPPPTRSAPHKMIIPF